MALRYVEYFPKYLDGNAGHQDIGSDNAGNTFDADADNVIETAAAAVGRFSGKAWRMGEDNVNILGITTISGTTVIINCSIQFVAGRGTADTNGSEIVFQIANSGGNGHGGIVVQNDMQVRVLGVGTGEVGRFNDAFRRGCWHHLEMKFSLLNTGGVEIKVDGVTVFTISGVDFIQNTADISQLRLIGFDASNTSSTGRVRMQELIVMDGSGATFNDFIGDCRIEAQVPDADGATTQWTPLASTNVSQIADALGSYDYETSYISSNTATQVNLASHAAFSLTDMTDILFVSVEALARTDAANTLQVRGVSNGNTVDSATRTLTATYQWHKLFLEVDPDGGAAWASAADINACEFGVELIA